MENKKQTYSKYVRAFGISYLEIKQMPRLKFAEKFGEKFKYMSSSKFNRVIEQIARAYERGNEILNQYK